MARRTKTITAAGAVVLRPGNGTGQELLLVHRPRYDDWTLPKGKLRADEYLPGCAARETQEETAVRVRLGIPADQIRYPISSGMKQVYYWRAQPAAIGLHTADAEVDEIAWLSITQALRRASYPDERALIRQAVNLPASTPLLIVRHAKAMSRSNWTQRDQARPLNERGRRQSKALTPLLAAYDVQRLASSSSIRCMRTFQPYAKAGRLEVEGWTTLTEERAEQDPRSVTKLMKRLVAATADTGIPVAICGHRPVLPVMLEAVGLEVRSLQPGAALVAHLGPTGKVLASELHKPRI